MAETKLIEKLEEVSGQILLALRMLEGLDPSAFQDLLNTVDQCRQVYSGRDEVPKELAAIFFDIYPAIVSASYLYEQKTTGEIQQAAEQFADRVRSCLLP